MPDMKEHFRSREDAPKVSKAERLVTPPPPWALEDPFILEALKSSPGRVVAALTGGAASGKSTISALLEAFGAKVIDLDVLAREAAAVQSPVRQELYEFLGPSFFLEDGSLDRAKTAAVAFKRPEVRLGLEGIIHPFCWKRMGECLREYAGEEVVIIDVPLLFEVGLEGFFHPTILSFVDQATQLERLLARKPRIDKSLAKRLLKSQWPILTKMPRTDFIIDNSGNLPATIRQCQIVWRELKGFQGPRVRPKI